MHIIHSVHLVHIAAAFPLPYSITCDRTVITLMIVEGIIISALTVCIIVPDLVHAATFFTV